LSFAGITRAGGGIDHGVRSSGRRNHCHERGRTATVVGPCAERRPGQLLMTTKTSRECGGERATTTRRHRDPWHACAAAIRAAIRVTL
jgi:hypothetical protein